MNLGALFARLLGKGSAGADDRVAGAVDGCRDGLVTGWIRDPHRPSVALQVDVLVDGVVVASGLASQARPDLAAIFAGEGRHGFAIVVDALAGPSLERRVVTVRRTEAPQDVVGSLEVPPSWDRGRSTFAGVGRFAEARLPDDVEEALFRQRLERAIAATER